MVASQHKTRIHLQLEVIERRLPHVSILVSAQYCAVHCTRVVQSSHQSTQQLFSKKAFERSECGREVASLRNLGTVSLPGFGKVEELLSQQIESCFVIPRKITLWAVSPFIVYCSFANPNTPKSTSARYAVLNCPFHEAYVGA